MRGRAIACAVALLVACGSAAGPASAREPEPRRPGARDQANEPEQSEGREAWRARLLAAHLEVAAARERGHAAREAYRKMRHRRRPRGEAKQAILDEIELSREALEEARQALEDLEKAARRAGAPPSWLRFDPAEIEAAMPLPASPDS